MTRLIIFAPALKRWETMARNPEPEARCIVVHRVLSIALSSTHAHAFYYERQGQIA